MLLMVIIELLIVAINILYKAIKPSSSTLVVINNTIVA
jgi:hypothetical protein